MPKATPAHTIGAPAAADAELIAAAAAYPAALRAIDRLNRRGDATDAEMQALLDRENSALTAAAALAARGPAGMAAKARLLLRALAEAEARYDEVGDAELAIARSLARDVIRLASAA